MGGSKTAISPTIALNGLITRMQGIACPDKKCTNSKLQWGKEKIVGEREKGRSLRRKTGL